jgi:hypothetical protein
MARPVPPHQLKLLKMASNAVDMMQKTFKTNLDTRGMKKRKNKDFEPVTVAGAWRAGRGTPFSGLMLDSRCWNGMLRCVEAT